MGLFIMKHLTLTSVVFESTISGFISIISSYLTLTSVVFEFACLIGTAIAKAI